ncbi:MULTISPECIES: DUF1269 domain-containing protein [unclassified Streptomyces]|uniref:DUF1269 domain-containing protein n=1 Tax=unclassified Streptomyces TaxID=2593676 RepID=UPI0006B024A3|nr:MULTISPECIES: DUF1269 domain-containing protein [unclassified Streptomyces]KOX36472.1 hypothetical protein ADL06_05020 [Streptomyces sp. NRRL F-6491]KOX51353.1 hypothetical protein ADL08_04715 [Streptomyces sp. NRRL F-6492]
MSELIVIGYDDHAVARKAFKTVQKLRDDHVVELKGLAVVRVDEDGETHVDTPAKSEEIALSATAGALWGLVLGMIVLTPGIGVVGAALGGLIGKLNQMGVDRGFRQKVSDFLEPGSAAVVVMASKITEDRFATAMEPFGGTVLKTSLPEQSERELAEQLTGPGSETA